MRALINSAKFTSDANQEEPERSEALRPTFDFGEWDFRESESVTTIVYEIRSRKHGSSDHRSQICVNADSLAVKGVFLARKFKREKGERRGGRRSERRAHAQHRRIWI